MNPAEPLNWEEFETDVQRRKREKTLASNGAGCVQVLRGGVYGKDSPGKVLLSAALSILAWKDDGRVGAVGRGV